MSHSDSVLKICGSYLRFEQRSEWLFRVCNLAGVNRDAAFDQAARYRDLALGIDARHVSEARPFELEQEQAITHAAVHAGARLRDRPTYTLDVHVMLLRPIRGDDVIGDIAAGGVASGDRAVLLGMPPVLQPYRSTRSGKARAVAGCENDRIAGSAMPIDNDAVAHREVRLAREPIIGRDAGAHHD